MDVYGVFVAIVEYSCALIGEVPTILLLGICLGIAIAVAPLVLAVAIIRLLVMALRRGAWRVRSHLRATTQWYFARLKFKGLTESACRFAVWCSLAVWIGVVVAFAAHF